MGPKLLTTGKSDLIGSPGNLPNDQYRFFVGHVNADRKWTSCRGCDVSCYSKEDRDQHLTSCKHTVLNVLYRMRQDKLCAVCQERTDRTCWGVPLCGTNCETAWKFHLPQAFREERRIAAKNLVIEAS
jgi:hypothetical protein